MMRQFIDPPNMIRERAMESHRSRRTRDQARKAWYAYYRQVRFARWFGVIEDANVDRVFQGQPSIAGPELAVPSPFSDPHINASC
jgi:hypothetical protein